MKTGKRLSKKWETSAKLSSHEMSKTTSSANVSSRGMLKPFIHECLFPRKFFFRETLFLPKFIPLTLKALGFFSTSRPGGGGLSRTNTINLIYSRKRKGRKMKLCILIVEWLSFRIKLKNLWWRHYLCGDVIIKLMLSSKFKNSYKSTRELIFKAKMGIETSIDVLKHFFSPLSQYFVVISIFCINISFADVSKF